MARLQAHGARFAAPDGCHRGLVDHVTGFGRTQHTASRPEVAAHAAALVEDVHSAGGGPIVRALVLAWQPRGHAGSHRGRGPVHPEGNGTRVDLEHRDGNSSADRRRRRAEYGSDWGDVLRLYAAAGRDNGPAIASLILGLASVVLPVLGILAAPFAIAQ